MPWVYFIAAGRAPIDATLDVALRLSVIWCPSQKTTGELRPRVGDLAVGDRIVIATRAGRGGNVLLCATIAQPLHPAPGTTAIDQIAGDNVDELVNAGYPAPDDDFAEVIKLEDVYPCDFPVTGPYLGRNALRELTQADATTFENTCPTGAAPATTDSAMIPVAAVTPVQQLPTPFASQAHEPPAITESVGSLQGPVQTLFDVYIMVDWSSRNAPAIGADSIWIAHGEWNEDMLDEQGRQINCQTRSRAMEHLRELIGQAREKKKRVLLGFDFAFGYPTGFAAALALAPPDWNGLFAHLAASVTDNAQNQHNRDAFATACNAIIGGGGPGPFWGCPRGAANPTLTTNRVGIFAFPYAGLAEFRTTEQRARDNGTNTQSVWKLNQGVSVGGQAVLGIKHLQGLRAAFPDGVKIWPFETGFNLPSDYSVIVAEIFPSVLPVNAQLGMGVRDLAQVRTCVRHSATLDGQGNLRRWFLTPPHVGPNTIQVALREEGWILFV